MLDSPGILPMRISDQAAAIKLAICDDIGERSYDFTDVAAILVQMLERIPAVGLYSFNVSSTSANIATLLVPTSIRGTFSVVRKSRIQLIHT